MLATQKLKKKSQHVTVQLSKTRQKISWFWSPLRSLIHTQISLMESFINHRTKADRKSVSTVHEAGLGDRLLS